MVHDETFGQRQPTEEDEVLAVFERRLRDRPSDVLQVFREWRAIYPWRETTKFIDWTDELLDVDIFEIMSEDEGMEIVATFSEDPIEAVAIFEGLRAWP